MENVGWLLLFKRSQAQPSICRTREQMNLSLEHLNPQQRAAVEHEGGPLPVLAVLALGKQV